MADCLHVTSSAMSWPMVRRFQGRSAGPIFFGGIQKQDFVHEKKLVGMDRIASFQGSLSAEIAPATLRLASSLRVSASGLAWSAALHSLQEGQQVDKQFFGQSSFEMECPDAVHDSSLIHELLQAGLKTCTSGDLRDGSNI